MDFAKELHRELADAAKLVWGTQAALRANGGQLTPQIADMSKRLAYRIGIINGHMERWELWHQAEVTEVIPTDAPESKQDVAAYCLKNAANIYLRGEINGVPTDLPLTWLKDQDLAKLINYWWEQRRYPSRVVMPPDTPAALFAKDVAAVVLGRGLLAAEVTAEEPPPEEVTITKTCYVGVSLAVTMAYDTEPSPKELRADAIENFMNHPALKNVNFLGGFIDSIRTDEGVDLTKKDGE